MNSQAYVAAGLRSTLILLLLWTISDSTLAQTENLLGNLTFRSIGPAVTGGRIHDVEALSSDPATVYVATATGGIWKSTNKGVTWAPLFDKQSVSTFGDLAVSPSHPDILWAGTGEQNNRQSSSWGNGVYRSDDGGVNWSHKGLSDTRHIGRVLVHPHNPNVAYVAALGNLWRASPARGVYKTADGGETWSKVLYINDLTGAVDLVMDPRVPNTLYAATYQRMRRTWGFNGGGAGSGIYKTTDAGTTWTELVDGLPAGDKGRIGLAISVTNSRVLYGTIEHPDQSGTYRSDNGGESWVKVNTLNPRPMYYSHIFVDPTDENRVFILGTDVYMSEDGGNIFRVMPTRPTYDVGVHADHHAMWINPANPRHIYLAGDAGLHESWDRGETFARLNNIPIGQFYAIGLDNRTPYYIYGGMQDNHSWAGPSATRRWTGIVNDDWNQVGFGDGMYQQVDPYNYRDVYVNAQNGNLTRVDAETGDILDIRPSAPDGERYRWDWVTPSLTSVHRPGTIYFGGNRLFISQDRGVSWSYTMDLSRSIDRDSLEIMGVVGSEIKISKHDGTSSYGEITTIAESPITGSVLWVGTDDGNVQVSNDSGGTWEEVGKNINGNAEGRYVSRVLASNRSVNTAYVTLDAHRDGDFRPYVFRTEDAGQTWERLIEGLPEDGAVNVLVEHPENSDVLFLGTERALFVSLSAGREWIPFKANLPTTLYDDMKIHARDNALVIGTHGRSIWILDDLTPLEEWNKQVAASSLHLFSIPDLVQHHYWKTTSYRGHSAYAGRNPEPGAPISYYLGDTVDSVLISVETGDKTVIRKMRGSGVAGVLHRIYWDGRHAPPPSRDTRTNRDGLVRSKQILPEPAHPLSPQGPFVSPGTYTVRVKAGTVERMRTVRVSGDPLMDISPGQALTRELFLLTIAGFHREAWEFTEMAGSLLEGLQGRQRNMQESSSDWDQIQTQIDTVQAREQRIRIIARDFQRLASAFNGNGVRQGSMQTPTNTHLMRRDQLIERLDSEHSALQELAEWLRSLR